MKKKTFTTYKIAFIGVMAAVVCVVTFFRFPLLGSKVHFANAMCLLSGMLFGGVYGGIAAGLGSALYDAVHGYDLINVLITFVSKFMMAWVCARVLWHKNTRSECLLRTAAAAILGALTYVALYMLKTFVFQAFIYHFPMNTVWATMLSKFIPAIINAAVAMVAAPVLYKAMLPALRPILQHAGNR